MAEHTEVAACGRPFGDADGAGGRIVAQHDDVME